VQHRAIADRQRTRLGISPRGSPLATFEEGETVGVEE